jgi:hypothetical protein
MYDEQVHNVSAGLARAEGAHALFDMIEIEKNDPVVTNALIDYADVERLLLFEDNNDAARIFKSTDT